MRTILPYQENPALRQIAAEIKPEDIGSPWLTQLISEMQALLAKEKYGVAIAANQVGESVRMFIVSGRALANHADDDDEDDDGRKKERPALPDQVYINPVMLKMSRGRKLKHEGCLSVKGKWGNVPRAEKATVRAYDEHGRVFTRGASGFLAHVFQHEIDHLEGTLYIDKAHDIRDDTDTEKEEEPRE